MKFRFGRYELDEEAGELRLDGEALDVQPKPLALLSLLVRHRERVVSQEELFEALWPGVVVTASSLTRAVSLARRACPATRRATTAAGSRTGVAGSR
jgi:DNA-binding winged helix-turn-helix (wHTH) protein